MCSGVAALVNDFLNSPSIGIVSVPVLWLTLCSDPVSWSLMLLLLLKFQADFLCFIFPFLYSMLFSSVSFHLWLLHFICCLHLLGLRSSADHLLLSKKWKVMLWARNFGKGRRKGREGLWGRKNRSSGSCLLALQENEDKPAHPDVTFSLMQAGIPIPNLYMLLLLN